MFDIYVKFLLMQSVQVLILLIPTFRILNFGYNVDAVAVVFFYKLQTIVNKCFFEVWLEKLKPKIPFFFVWQYMYMYVSCFSFASVVDSIQICFFIFFMFFWNCISLETRKHTACEVLISQLILFSSNCVYFQI